MGGHNAPPPGASADPVRSVALLLIAFQVSLFFLGAAGQLSVRQVVGNAVFRNQASHDWYHVVEEPLFSQPATTRCKKPVLNVPPPGSPFHAYMSGMEQFIEGDAPIGGYAWMDNAVYDTPKEVLYQDKPGAQEVHGIRRLSCYEEFRTNYDPVVSLPQAAEDRSLATKTAVLLGPVLWAEGFYHFFTDSILHLVQIPGHVLSSNVTLVFGPMQDRWRVFLEYLGYGHMPVLSADLTKRYVFGRAYLPSGARCGLSIPARVKILHARFVRHLAAHPIMLPVNITKPLTLLVGRAGSRRQLPNWDALVRKLREVFGARHQFEEHTNAHSPQHSMALFHAASTVVGLHGAGMTQLIFSLSGTRVVEITPAPMYGAGRPFNYCYPFLACGRHMPYWVFPVAGTGDGYHQHINVDEFANFLKEVYAYHHEES
jgi:hypothetical protein